MQKYKFPQLIMKPTADEGFDIFLKIGVSSAQEYFLASVRTIHWNTELPKNGSKPDWDMQKDQWETAINFAAEKRRAGDRRIKKPTKEEWKKIKTLNDRKIE